MTAAQERERCEKRAELIVDRINDRLDAIHKAVPPIRPPAAFWLDSDAGPSYCRKCAVIARGREFELGPLLVDGLTYDRSEWEDLFFEGIDGGFDTTSDSAAACDICGRTLSYILTDYGVESEIAYYREAPLCAVRDEDTYALDRLCLNVYEGSTRSQILGAAIAVNQAFRILSHPADTAGNEA